MKKMNLSKSLFPASLLLLFGQYCFAQIVQNKTENILIPLNSSISDCLTACSGQSEVINATLTDSIYNTLVGAHLNCSVHSTSKITYTLQDDTLNILIPEFQISSDTTNTTTDSTATTTIIQTISSASCKCFFHVNLTIEKYTSKPKVVLINGETFEENYRRRSIRVKEN